MLKGSTFAVLLALTAQPAMAQFVPPPSVAAEAPANPDAIPLYGAETPGSTSTENWALFAGANLAVRNVTHPTITPVLPDPANANGTAVIVAPGGAFMLLAWEEEGMRVARALADRGITAFVLKYRLLPTPADEAEAARVMVARMMAGLADPTRPPSLQNSDSTDDALAALALVRAGAAQWHVNPDRVGMIGFSAGAMTSLNAALAADSAQRPAFVGYIYGPQPAPVVPADAPPLFVAIALDDPLFTAQGFPIVSAWHQAGRPVELHAYGTGGHGFGTGRPGTTTSLVMDEFAAWMAMQGFLPNEGAQ